jgi:trans-aconitate methyltransferase
MPFSAKWLSLREPIDEASRSAVLTRELADMLAEDRPLAALDLGCGTGANVRYLLPRLPSNPQHWLLIDNDRALLARVPMGMSDRAAIATACQDLRDVDAIPFRGRKLVTAAALLDLVSDAWLRLLIAHCRLYEAAVLFPLVYDGRMRCDPLEPEDEMIRELINRHQHRDKGFGDALGPDAPDATVDVLKNAGYRVSIQTSDWNLSPAMGNLQRELIRGWAQAATEIARARAAVIGEWADRRFAHVDRGRSRILVGHRDIAGFL